MALGGEADCGWIRKGKTNKRRLWSEVMRVRKKMNGVGKRSRLRTDLQEKGKRGGGWGGEKLRGRENQKSSGR